MIFNAPVKTTRTNYADINQFIDNTEDYLTQLSTDLNTAFAELPQYSTEPQQIGTWIDGSPIYRKAFNMLLKDMSELDYADTLSNQTFTVDTSTDSSSAYPISAFCGYADAMGALYLCGISIINTTSVDFGVPDGVTIPKDQGDCTTELYYGYIDFIKRGDVE